jgi:hypothetical protein
LHIVISPFSGYWDSTDDGCSISEEGSFYFDSRDSELLVHASKPVKQSILDLTWGKGSKVTSRTKNRIVQQRYVEQSTGIVGDRIGSYSDVEDILQLEGA